MPEEANTQSTEPEEAEPESQEQLEAAQAEATPINLQFREGKLFIGEEASDLTLEDIKKGKEMKKSFYSKAEEGARARKEAQEAFAKLNDVNFLLSDEQRANALEKFYENKFASEYERMQADQMQKDDLLSKNLAPEQVELLMEAQKILSENKRLKEEKELSAKERAEKERQDALIEYNKQAEAAYIEALKIAGLKPSIKNVTAMRDYHLSIIGSEAEDHFGEAELSEYIKEFSRDDARENLSDVSDADLLDYVGEEFVKRLVKLHTARIQKVGVANKKDASEQEADKAPVSSVFTHGFGFGR